MTDEIQSETTTEERSNNIIEQTNAAADRLERANAQIKATMEQQKAMQMEFNLSGKSHAGAPETKEESNSDYAARVLRGDFNAKNTE